MCSSQNANNTATPELISPEQELIDDIHEAAESRLNASRRLKYLSRTLAFALALISGYLIWMNVWPMVRPLCQGAIEWSALFSVGLSLIIMSVSILVYAGDYGHKAEMFNECSIELNKLWRDCVFMARAGASVETKSDAFYAIITKYPENHEMVDLMKYRISHGVGQIRFRELLKFRIRIVLAHYYGIIGLVTVTAAVLGLVSFVEFGSNLATCKS